MTIGKLIFEKIELDFSFREFTFQSGINKLDQFFYEYSSKFIKYGYSQVYILRDAETPDVMGFFFSLKFYNSMGRVFRN